MDAGRKTSSLRATLNYFTNSEQESGTYSLSLRPASALQLLPSASIGMDWNGYRAYTQRDSSHGLFRKEVIQPQVLLRLPCYDFTPIMSHTLGRCLLAVGARTSSTTHFRDVTGGVYKARERIHGGVLIRHY